MSLEKFIKEHKEAFDSEKMPEQATLDFEARLKGELHSSGRLLRLKIIRYSSIAAILILLITVGYISNSDNEQEMIKENLILSLDVDQANSKRLEAIYEIEEQYQKEDEKILNAFFKILNGTSDSNSKIAVIDALLKFPNNQLVRNNIIEALENEKEPLVQLKLIKSVAILREQRAKKPLQQIIENKESLPQVKGNASASLAMLSQ